MRAILNKHGGDEQGTRRRLKGSALATVGYLLSPLSWWNDLVINIPLAYIFSSPFALISERLFLPMFVAGYWLTNVLGFLLLHRGIVGLLGEEAPTQRIGRYMMVTFLYTVVMVMMVCLDWIPMPNELLQVLE